jgi:hypothetical protein
MTKMLARNAKMARMDGTRRANGVKPRTWYAATLQQVIRRWRYISYGFRHADVGRCITLNPHGVDLILDEQLVERNDEGGGKVGDRRKHQ